MNIIIAGAGEVGVHLAKMLSTDKHNITLVDNDEDKLRVIGSQMDVLTVQGSIASLKDLKEIRVGKADLFIAVTKIHETNIIGAIFSKKLGATTTIARVDNEEYIYTNNKKLLIEFGIDALIYPSIIAAHEIVASLKLTGTRQVQEFSGGKLVLFGVKLYEGTPIIGMSLQDVSQKYNKIDYRVVAISRKYMTIVPDGAELFEKDDIVFFVVHPLKMDDIMDFLRRKHHKIKDIMILGGSSIGFTTARLLEKDHNVKLIEINKDKCETLADNLQKALVINGDAIDLNLLQEEGLNKMDAFIAVTGKSETNILSCLMAKKHGIRKTIAEVENLDFINLAGNIDIGTLINKKQIAASYIYRFTMKATVTDFKMLTAADAEVLEFIVKPKAKITEGYVKDLKFPGNANIGGIIRGEKCIIPKGDTQIIPDDKVLVFMHPTVVKKVERFFN